MRFVQRYFYIIYPSVFGLYVLNMFLGSTRLEWLIGLAAIPVLIFSYAGASRLFRILGGVFIVAGAGLFLYAGLPAVQLPMQMTATMPLLAFLTVLPWMNSVVRAGRFDRRINDLMKVNVADFGKLYVRSSFTTYLLVMFMNLSALPLTQEVLKGNMKNVKKRVSDSFISRVTLRAFTLALLWSPMEVMVAMTVDATGVSYLTFLPWLFLASVTLLMIDWLWNKKTFGQLENVPDENRRIPNIQPGKMVWQIAQLLLALTVFLGSVVTLGNGFGLDFILSVTLVILPFAFTWAFLMGRFRSFRVLGWNTWKVRTNGMQNFVVLFISLSLFSESLNATPFMEMIQGPFLAAADTPILILLLIQFTYLAMSMIGVHPVATIAVLAEVLSPLYDLVNPVSIGIIMIMGALATATVGTYGVTVTMTAMNTEQNPYRITLRNMPFALLCGSVGTLIGWLLL
ncbi:hypothetical protein [Salisediminibacterium halotolerans]|uniref:hypothetical protein n=1 Tax=Salisediminibacterium halotolerans TaxID=517425 RepID=UPI000EAE51A8|nr:hypothetical protein [Salisediminibacterium halotolerans]RLJ73118.1 hypothetical protein BCL39_1866 [Actinophytocola xinjiangensis]RPE86540.1 hypothetical protein EDD67_1989 [Salisediminibacterium halotolerans]TWG33915.1 hypothetical protein BCL52_1863 [Salisediminibacterium halotolerans]GEL08686.1 hypothetical protein SHA02_21020 [Salisediminibacterium halotolerans]